MPTYANLKNRRYQETPAQHRANPNMHVASVRIDIPQESVPWSKDITTFKYESCTIQLEIWDSTVATIATWKPALLGPSNYKHQWIYLRHLRHLRVSSSNLGLIASVVSGLPASLHLMPPERNQDERFFHYGDNQDANY